MATWNSTQPLRVTQIRETQEKVNGRNEKIRNFEGFKIIKMGDPVPEELLTVSFIGETLDQLANLTAEDRAKLDEWERQNPRLADRWDHIKKSPHRFQSIFPHEPNILTVGAMIE